MSEHSVLLLSIGPVQDMIASARRCRDLWFGSGMLAEAAKAAAIAISDECSRLGVSDDGCAALVFPGVSPRAELEKEHGVANRILARVPGNVEDVSAIARRAVESARTKLRELARTAFDSVERQPRLARYFRREVAEAQVEDLLDVHWVVVPEKDSYSEARKRADLLLAARKNTRCWAQPSWSAAVPKSSLDGARESVIDEALFDDVAAGRIGAADVYATFRAHPSERLCGVAVLKRLGRGLGSDQSPEGRFFSTSHLAGLPWFEGAAARPGAEVAWRCFSECLREVFEGQADEVLEVAPRAHPIFGRADGSVLFEGRLTQLAEELLGSKPEDATVKKLHGALRQLRKAVTMPEPLPYFAVLLADGDKMGAAISKIESFDGHQSLSRSLASFARGCKEIVEDHAGSLVYAGGDDVLALLPVHTAVACADELRVWFSDALSDLTLGADTPTLSVGLAIGHHLVPLDATLSLARRAEKLAKQERNSLALILDKRGGTPVEITGRWDESPNLVDRLSTFTQALRDDLIPDKAAYELAALERLATPKLAVPGLREPEGLHELLKAEVARVLSRRRGDHGKSKMDPEQLRGAANADPARTGRELIVARDLERAQSLARPTHAPEEAGQ